MNIDFMNSSEAFTQQHAAKKNKHIQKIVIVCVVIAMIVLFKIFGLEQYFTLEYIKTSQVRFTELYAAHRELVVAAYMGIYIVMAALSLPGAAVMTLLGGALFGLVVGTIVVSFASTIGATLACVVARFLLRDWVQNKVGDKINLINEGIDKEGAFYLFTMRLIPAFPFWMINLVMGLTRLRLLTFYWVSQIGMLAGTMVYVNAGKELAKIDSLGGILSPSLIVSFIMLGLFPITVKKLVSWYKMQRDKW